MALTAPPPRRALLSAADSLLLLLLGAAAGSSHFLDKTQLTKKGDAHLKQEGIIRIHNSVAPSEPMKITSIPDVPQTPHQILGKENSTVPVYVPINSKGLILKCLTEKLLKQGINHPEYQWVGPMGLITKVYHKPGESLHLASEFKTESCETSAVVSFGKRLEDLKKLIHDLQCGIQQWNMQCHAATDTIAMITHKLTFQFVDPCESSDCENSSSCIKKAYTKIHQFLRVLRSQDHNQQMHYIPGSLTGLKIDHCKPGFGTLHIWIVFLVIPTGVIVVVLTSWVIIQLCCRRRLAVQYIEAEAELKTKLKTFANLATDAEIQAQRRKLRSPAKYDRKHLPKTKSGCLQEESRALLSNVTVTETSTPFGSDHFPDYTWPNKVETSFEEGISETTLGEE
ncbi:zona pellucida-binding protein 1-like isoform X4 [Dromaius novaehollandiae]|uniref:zona pellucida-binding protein 1-like isoform X4 n=1 Tax=Dromaius novaehollandiae TaxID=8790 RepID=UPI00311EA433